MIKIKRSDERGRGDRGWLKSHFTFSFADYSDPSQMGFRALRVINEDRIAPGKGFGPHAHRDMEIITYVLEGKLLHRDSMGEQHVLGPNEIQTMSAGTGVVHSEWNASETEPVHLFQIWILPAAEDFEPAYQQIGFDQSELRGRLRLLAAPEKSGDAPMTTIHQDARVYAAEVARDQKLKYPLGSRRNAWIQVVKGTMQLNGTALFQGDAAAVTGEEELLFSGNDSSTGEFLLFDLP
jgi:redox-sensitive bicupin YhaK (pirin superfamily)